MPLPEYIDYVPTTSSIYPLHLEKEVADLVKLPLQHVLIYK